MIRQRSEVEVAITRIIGRPAQIGHIGEYIAAKVFRIALAPSASEKGYDGRFEDGPPQGRTVNIKWYAKREGVLDIEPRSDCASVVCADHRRAIIRHRAQGLGW